MVEPAQAPRPLEGVETLIESLAEFLLDRIAEDERIAEQWPNEIAIPGEIDTLGHPIYRAKPRILAECKAKREIVQSYLAAVEADHAIVFDGNDAVTMLQSLAAAAKAEGCKEAMRSISLVYRDHPQYDPIWTLA